MTLFTTILTTKVHSELSFNFADWQAELNTIVATFPGFVSLEITSTAKDEWAIVQRFDTCENLKTWCQSHEKLVLQEKLKTIVGQDQITETESSITQKSGVTEIFVTEVTPDNDAAYRKWIAKIHQAEAKFTGFQGVYVQSPTSKQSRHWVTLLQFDTSANLNRWIDSAERKAILGEALPLITSLQTHRVVSSYSGWFSDATRTGAIPPVWKQTMLVLLVLYPIVMLQLKYLVPVMSSLSLPVSTFINNAISVTLISWPCLPVAIYFLRWWLSPEKTQRGNTLTGILILLTLYIIEIFFFLYFY